MATRPLHCHILLLQRKIQRPWKIWPTSWMKSPSDIITKISDLINNKSWLRRWWPNYCSNQEWSNLIIFIQLIEMKKNFWMKIKRMRMNERSLLLTLNKRRRRKDRSLSSCVKDREDAKSITNTSPPASRSGDCAPLSGTPIPWSGKQCLSFEL